MIAVVLSTEQLFQWIHFLQVINRALKTSLCVITVLYLSCLDFANGSMCFNGALQASYHLNGFWVLPLECICGVMKPLLIVLGKEGIIIIHIACG